MPEYLAPGVYVEEVSFRSKSIEGVGTSVAGIVGPTRTGPLRGTPELLTSFADFQRIYGDLNPLEYDDKKLINHTAIAAKAFFDNGGKQLYVSRVVADVNKTDAHSRGSTATFATKSDTDNKLTFTSRFPGKAGNYALEFIWRDSENLLRYQSLVQLAADQTVLLEVSGVTKDAKGDSTLEDSKFPLNVTALVTLDNDKYHIVNTPKIISRPGTAEEQELTPDDSKILTELLIDKLDNPRLTQVKMKAPVSGALSPQEAVILNFTQETDLSRYTGKAHWGPVTTLLASRIDDYTISISDTLNEAVTETITLNLSALAAAPNTLSTIMVQRQADINVLNSMDSSEVIYSYNEISLAADSENSLKNQLKSEPDKQQDKLTSPVAVEFGNTFNNDEILSLLYSMFDKTHIDEPGLSGPRYLIELQDGSDGNAPSSTDYAGEADETNGSTGFAALENIEDIAIVMAPAAAQDASVHQAVVNEMLIHCQKMRYRIGIVDSEEGMALSEIRNFRSQFNSDRLALYYPWVQLPDPAGTPQVINVPPAGFVAGVYARTDVERGVHKAPANTPVLGALRFAQDINTFQQDVLNPNHINCLRSFPGRGHLIWGARTLSTDPEWKYVNVRRYFMYLERSIEKSTQWVVFEPNAEKLWANIRATVEGFLYNEWSNGRLMGATPDEAFFVRCDRSTMTQNDLDNGRLVCLIGVAPIKPAEFVVFRIGQFTSDANK